MIPFYLEGRNHPLPLGEAGVKAQYGMTPRLMPGTAAGAGTAR